MAFALRSAAASLAAQQHSTAPLRCIRCAAARSGFFGVSPVQAARLPKLGGRPGRTAGIATVSLFGGATVTKDSIYDYKVKDIDGRDVELKKYAGKVLLIVNVASQCGFTPQYKELGELYNKYKSKGYECGQEPGSNSQIKSFAQQRGAKFQMFEKVEVNGKNAEPLYDFLKKKQSGLFVSDIKWNFTKFLVDREGNVVQRYGSSTTPLQIEADIQKLL